MKSTYFAYSFQNVVSGEKFLYDMRPLLNAFCNYSSADFKNTFFRHDEHLYFFNGVGDSFLFLMTRSGDLVKKIDTSSLSYSEISSLLKQNEKLGFSSHITMKSNCFGFASTMYAPKIDVFSDFINDLLVSLGIDMWRFVPHALIHQATKGEMLSLPYMGRTTIEVGRENNFFKKVSNLISARIEDVEDISSIEITIKPKPRANIKNTIKKILPEISNDDVYKMMIKSRDEISSNSIDLYLAGSGAISDAVDKSKEEKVPYIMEQKMKENKYLKEKLAEYINNECLESIDIDVISRFVDADSWASVKTDLLHDS